tara:strand:- start:70796 stop:72085 length:1290 start_codon:yes stop_codon:yes gene_type:complete
MAGCQSLSTEPVAVASAPAIIDPPVAAVVAPAVETAAAQPPRDLWERMRRELSWQSMDNAQITRARERFLRQYSYLPVIAQRAQYYLYYIVEEVEKRGMPMEIALLPLVESTLDPFASSPSSAAGLWQIMPATGRHLGLQKNWWWDGRRDLRASTRAALDYLEGLHQSFDGDWLLALAAYNSGKGRVNRAQRNNSRAGKPTDYWSLKLPRETRDYVPRLVALSQIVATPAAFNARIPTVPNAPAFGIADTAGQLELMRAAELAGIDLKTLRAFNPGQLRWATAPTGRSELLLPLAAMSRFSAGLATLSPEDRVRWRHYRIERGDSLIRIARQFNTQVGLLREVNGIRGSRIRAGDTLMIPNGSGWADSLALAGSGDAIPRDYRVRSGDSLYVIAGRFKVSIKDIIAWNELDPGKYLQPGQQLTLYVSDG